MAKAKAQAEAKPAEVKREIKGELKFQRVGGGMATFKAICPDVLSNPVVQFKAGIMPADYDPLKHDVQGEYVYRFVMTKKPVKK